MDTSSTPQKPSGAAKETSPEETASSSKTSIESFWSLSQLKHALQQNSQLGALPQSTLLAINTASALFLQKLVSKAAANNNKNDTVRCVDIRALIQVDPQYEFLRNVALDEIVENDATAQKRRAAPSTKSLGKRRRRNVDQATEDAWQAAAAAPSLRDQEIKLDEEDYD